jgi:hypothetical protein
MASIFIQVVAQEEDFKELYHLSLVHKNDVHEIDLVVGSHAIPDALYSDINIFGKKDQNPERQFGFQLPALQQSEVAGSDVHRIISRLRELLLSAGKVDDPRVVCFLKLTKIQ